MNRIILSFLFLILTVACTPSVQLGSESIRSQQIFCSPFNENGFTGLLTTQNTVNSDYGPDETLLILNNIPNAFKQNRDSYIQMRSQNYTNSRSQVSDPLQIQFYNHRSGTIPFLNNYIDHNVMSDLETNTEELLSTYHFIIQGTAGWQIILIALYNVHNSPILETRVLIPPFEMNPHTFKQNHSADSPVYTLHPLFDLIQLADPHDLTLFSRKARQFCQ